jgi:TRAP-type mannitol/chloroaromatic compound transport system permease small subunit
MRRSRRIAGAEILGNDRRTGAADTMNAMLNVSEVLRRLLERIALVSGWLLVVMAAVTTFDVIARKAGLQLPFTKLQELEWHFHAAIFSLWMGYCYTINAHPRVDSFTERLSHRGRAWVELFGCLLLALPYVALVAYYSIDFVALSYNLSERSDSSVGLTNRWIIKLVYAIGLWLVVLGVVSVMLRVIVFLFSGKSEKEVNLQIGHVAAEV